MPSPREQPKPERKRRRQDSMPGAWLWTVVMLLLRVVLYITLLPSVGSLDYSEFVKPVVLTTLFFIAIIVFFFVLPRFRDPFGSNFLNNYIRSPAKRYDKTKSRTTYDDVADMTNAKRELQEIVEFLKYPEKFQKLGAQ